MKRFALFMSLIFISSLATAQLNLVDVIDPPEEMSILNLTEYPKKTSHVKKYEVSLEDKNGKISETSPRKLATEYFFDKENYKIYKLFYDDENQPSLYIERNYDKNLLPVTEFTVDKYGKSKISFKYSSDFKSAEAVDDKNQIIEKGEITDEFGDTAIFYTFYDYDDDGNEKEPTVIKFLTKERINNFKEINKLSTITEVLNFVYRDGQLKGITDTTFYDRTKTIKKYSDEGEYGDEGIKTDIVKYDEKGLKIYSTDEYSERYIKYLYDDIGSITEEIYFYASPYSKLNGSIYVEPIFKSINEINYTTVNPIKCPETFY